MRINSQQIEEAILGLPTTMNPYAPSARQDTDMNGNTSKPAGPAEIPQAGEPSSTPQPIASADGVEDNMSLMPKINTEPEGEGALEGGWEKIELSNKKDLGFKRADGFFLRFRAIDSVPGKYMAQLWKDKETLDKGFVMVPEGDDPEEFIQGMADAMLDDGSQRYEQKAPEISDEAPEGAGPEGEAPGGGGGGGGLGGLGGGGAGGLDAGPVKDDLGDTGEVEPGDLAGAEGGVEGAGAGTAGVGGEGEPGAEDLPTGEGPELERGGIDEKDLPPTENPENEDLEFGDEDFTFDDEVTLDDIPKR